MSLLLTVIYAAILIFIAAIVARGVRIARMPMHLRWELQPVPHERPGQSMFEKVDWWTHSRDKNHFGELGVMIPEILLLKGVWEHNRGLWFASWALHFGLYLLIGNMFLGLLLAILLLVGLSPGEGIAAVISALIRPVALVGGGLGTLGAIAMFIKRTRDKGMRTFATPSHYINIVHLGAIYVTAFFWALTDPGFVVHLSGLYAGVVTAGSIAGIPVWGYLNIAVVLLFLVYLPFTHMTHFFTKYFTYHAIRWEDAPNVSGGELEEKIKANVTQPVSWAAPHVGADGKKTWLDLVSGTGEVKQEKKEA